MKNIQKSLKALGGCPHCGSTNLASEPVYKDENEVAGEDSEDTTASQIAVYCFTCGHYLGVIESEIRKKSRSLQDSFVEQFIKNKPAE